MQPEEMLTVCGDMTVDVSKSTSDSLNREEVLLIFRIDLLK